MFHIRNHSVYSYTQAIGKIKDIADEEKANGGKIFTITDLGSMTSWAKAFEYGKKNEIQFIPGYEAKIYPQSDANYFEKTEEIAFLTKENRLKRTTDEMIAKNNQRIEELQSDPGVKYHTLCLYAFNDQGLKSLVNIYNQEEYQYDQWTSSMERLCENADGVIAATGHLDSEAIYWVRKGHNDLAMQNLQKLQEAFGDHLYLLLEKHEILEADGEEIEDLGVLTENEAVKILVKMAQELGIKIIASSNSLYVHKEDRMNYRLFKNSFGEFDGIFADCGFVTDFHHINHPDELQQRLENAYGKEIVELAFHELHQLEEFLGQQTIYFPEAPHLTDNSEELRKLCEEGFQRLRKGTDLEEQSDKQWKYEFDVISEKNFTQYFIKVYSICKVARDLGILVGPGRGSGAGSEICFLLGITQVDPLKYGLYFERFLNPQRASYPDIDIDMASVPIHYERNDI